MGQHANQRAWLEFERLDRKRQDESFESEPSLSEDELAANGGDESWTRKDDATADELDRARWAYSLPVVRVRLFDEAGGVR